MSRIILLTLTLASCVLGQFITVSQPSTGTQWSRGCTVNIQWSSGGVAPSANVRILVERSDGQKLTVTGFTANSGSYTYTVPISEGIYDPATFSAAGGGTFIVSVIHDGLDETKGDSGTFTIMEAINACGASSSSGSGATSTTSGSPTTSDGSSGGTATETSSTTDDTSVGTTTTGSSVDCTSMAVFGPAENEFTEVYRTTTVQWHPECFATTRLRFDLYQGLSPSIYKQDITANDANDGSEEVTLSFTGRVYGTDYRIKVTSSDDPDLFSYGPFFTIFDKVVEVEDFVKEGEIFDVTWASDFFSDSTVEIEVLKAGNFYTIVSSTPNDGTWTGTMPNVGGASTSASFSVSDSSRSAYTDSRSIRTGDYTEAPDVAEEEASGHSVQPLLAFIAMVVAMIMA